jgi:putative peptidoglycan lipid II flippase
MKLLSLPTPADTVNRKIFRATLIVGSFTLAARLAGTVKELIVAQSFGRGDEVDAFLIAFLLPSFALNIGMTALGSALVPVFISVRQRQGKQSADQLFSSTMLLGVGALLALAALLGGLATFYLPAVGHSFSPAKLELTRRLLYLLLPWILFGGIAALATAVLNASEKFALPALTPLLTPFVTICFVLSAAQRWGVFTLAVGTACGSFLEAAVLLYLLKRHGIDLKLRWKGLDANVRRVLAQYAPMLAGGVLMGSTSVVDQAMAAILPSGNVAALGYANKLIGAIVSLGALALGTATLPYFAAMVAANDWAGCRHTLKRYSLLLAGVTVPFTVLLIAFSHPIVRVLYQRGAFTPADTDLVSRVQVCYALQIPFYVCGMIFVRFITAIHRNDVLMYTSAINLVLDIALNLLLMRIWHVAGIALSTSIMYAISFLIISTWTVRFLSKKRMEHLSDVQPEPAGKTCV